MILVFTLSLVLSVTVLKNNLNLTLYSNEIYTSNLLLLFSGISLKFTRICPDATCELDTVFNFTESNFEPMPNSQITQINKITTSPSPNGFYILFYSGLSLIIQELNTNNKSASVKYKEELEINFPGAVILQGILCHSIFVLLVQVPEEIKDDIFTKHEILYSDFSFEGLNTSKCLWDLKYTDYVIMSASDSDLLAFGVKKSHNKTGQIFIYNFTDPECPELIQFIDRFLIVPEEYGDLWYPDPIDMTIQGNKLLILNSNNILVSLLLVNGTYKEISYTNFTDFIKVRSISSPDNFYVDQTIFSINSDKAVAVCDMASNSEIFYITSSAGMSNDSIITLSQNIYPNVFFTSFSNDSGPFFEFVYYNEFVFRYLFFEDLGIYSNITNKYAPWVVIPGKMRSKFLVRQDFEGIQLFEFEVPTFNYQIITSKNTTVQICAQDSGGIGCCNISITVVNTTDDIYLIVDNQVTPEYLFMQDIYFYSLSQSHGFYINSLVSGWNVSYNIEISFMNETDYIYDIIDYDVLTPPESVSYGFNVLNGGYYRNKLYVIDEIGLVYLNGSLLSNQFGTAYDITPVRHDNNSIIISYPDFLQFRMFINSLFTNITTLNIGYTCDKVKNYGLLTICSSSFKLSLINTDLHIFSSISYQDLDYESIIDFEFTYTQIIGYKYLYVLTTQSVYLFSLYVNKLNLEKKIPVNGLAILIGSGLICVVGKNEYAVFNLYLDILYSNVTMLSPYEKAYLWGNALSVQSNNNVYVYQTTNRYLNALAFTFYIGDCQLQRSSHNTYMTLCKNNINLYSSSCPPVCQKSSALVFTLLNIQNITRGEYPAFVPVLVYNSNKSMLINMYYTLFTYGAANFFDYSQVNLNLSYLYNVGAEMDLQNFINGYDIKTHLLIDKQTLITENYYLEPVKIINRYTTTNMYKSLEKIVDFTIVKNADLILALTETKLLVINQIAPFNFTNVHNLTCNKSIDLIIITQGSCESIDFIMRSKDAACFVCSCTNIKEIKNIYYDGKVASKKQIESYLIMFELNLGNYSITNIYNFSAVYKTNFLKVITGTDNNFILLQVTISTVSKEYNLNNHVFILKCIWLDSRFNVSLIADLNFYSLSLTQFHASDVDGVYLNEAKHPNSFKIYLYIADIFYGIRAVRLFNSTLSIFQNIHYSVNDPPVSISVCGSQAFVSSYLTNLKIFTISDNYLNFYVQYPASPLDKYTGISSLLSCSSYYEPVYLSFYLKNETSNQMDKLRVMNLDSTFNSSVHANLNIDSSDIDRAKSIFLNEQTIIFLDHNSTVIIVLYLSNPQLVFPAFSAKEWKNMKKTLGSDSFKLVIQSSNFAIVQNSSQFMLTRLGPESDHDESEISIFIFLFIILISFIVLLLVIAVLVYKKAIKRKNKISPVKKSQIEFSIKRMSVLGNRSILR